MILLRKKGYKTLEYACKFKPDLLPVLKKLCLFCNFFIKPIDKPKNLWYLKLAIRCRMVHGEATYGL